MNQEQENEIEMALTDKHLQRIIEYLKKLNWSEQEIIDFLDYLTR